jgi:hypothetical protein
VKTGEENMKTTTTTKRLPQFTRPDNGKRANGLVLWRGPSSVDGTEVVAIAVGLANRSTNSKTGDYVQTYILRADMAPTEAARIGADVSVCGGCPHRPSTGGACYVTLCQGPLAVWKAWRSGKYATAESADDLRAAGAGRRVRLGSYGDPVAVPVEVWQALTIDSTTHNGYTHMWRRSIAGAFKDLCMASVDSREEARKAGAAGWGTFRVTLPGSGLMNGERTCPASAEAGHKVQCEDCRGCDGISGRHWAIVAHGTKASRAKVQ